jgi:hypothetical protein
MPSTVGSVRCPQVGTKGGASAKARRTCRFRGRPHKWLSEKGLSLEVCGRLCERVTPRSASRNAVAFAVTGHVG